MTKQILQIESTSESDLRKNIISDVTAVLKAFSDSLHNPDKDVLLTRQETADLLSVSLVSLWDYTRKDLIPAFRIGSKVRYKKSDVMEALQKMNKFSE